MRGWTRVGAVPVRRKAATTGLAAACVTSLGLLAVLTGSVSAQAADPTSTTVPTTTATSTATSSPGSTATSSPGSTAAVSPTPSPSATGDGLSRAERQAERRKARQRAAAKAAQEASARAAAAAKIAAEKALQVAEQAHDAAVLVAASAAYVQAKADLVTARQTLSTAQTQLTEAQNADRAAQVELEAFVLAEQRATRDLGVLETRIAMRERDLGRLARSAYQTNGSMGEWAIVLNSTTPDQLADRLAFLQSVGSAGNAVLADLREDRADLSNAEATLSAARKRQEDARTRAAFALETIRSRAELAKAAADQVDAEVQARKEAYRQAQLAAVEDKRQYQVMQAASGALATRIVSGAAALATSAHPPQGSGEMVRPALGVVTSPFGPRLHPILRYVKLHTGIDFAAGDGIVYAADEGVVLFTEYNEAYGNMTVVDHGSVGGVRMTTLYAHQAAVGVKAGDRVLKGQPIGVIGSTGYATGPHLHFEVRVDGEPLDPGPFLTTARLPTDLTGGR